MDRLFKINDYELLSQKVYRILKARIIKGDLKTGKKLLENKIAKQLGVSRTPVREAIKGLAAEGLVKLNPNQGVIIINVSIKDVKEVLQIRRVLEGFAASIAAEKTSQEETSKLEGIIKKMSSAISKPKPDTVTYSELNAEFHNLIMNVCGNKRLMEICNGLSNSDHRFRIRALRVNSERLKYSLEEHQKIVEALKRRDAEQATRLRQKHAENILKNILIYGGKEGEGDKDAQN